MNKNDKKFILKIAGAVIVLMVGTACMAVYAELKSFEGLVDVEAVIVDEHRRNLGRRGGVRYDAVVEFEYAGETVQTIVLNTDNQSHPIIGASLPLVVDPTNPTRAYHPEWVTPGNVIARLVLVPIVFFGVIALILLGATLLNRRAK